MRVYHGTTAECAERFARDGIDAHLFYPRLIHGLQDLEPGLFVTPRLPVARRFGLYVLEIDVEAHQLKTPPTLRTAGASLQDALQNSAEPQALLVARVEPDHVRVVESYPNGHPFNPFDEAAWEP